MKEIFYVLIIMSLIGCAQKNDTFDSDYSVQDEMIPEVAGTFKKNQQVGDESNKIEASQTGVLIQKKIIKDGRMSLRVKDLIETRKRIDLMVKTFKGYIASENYSNTDYESSYSLKIRIPAAAFDNFVSEIDKVDDEVLFKSIDARDVTEQFIDLETRLTNKRNYLIRYNELLKQARNVEEILQIEEKIRVLEEEIESTEGKLKYLSDQVSFSTLELSISKVKDFQFNPGKSLNFFERLKQSLSKGWYGFVGFILFIFRLWPFIILILAGFLTFKKIRKAQLNRKK